MKYFYLSSWNRIILIFLMLLFLVSQLKKIKFDGIFILLEIIFKKLVLSESIRYQIKNFKCNLSKMSPQM